MSSNSLYILGNGPSLSKSLYNYSVILKKSDVIVVNYFNSTDWYEIIKPKYYMFVDPVLFKSKDEIDESYHEETDRFIKNLIEKTTWKINFIIPSYAKNSWCVKEIENNNKFINFYYVNMQDFNSFSSEKEKYQFWDKNIIAPPAQTVLHTCLYFGIFKRYQKIYIMGADTNTTEQYHMNQTTNEIYKDDDHFYGKRKTKPYADDKNSYCMKFHEVLEIFSMVLRYYWDLKYYADYANVCVYNASEYSLIDAFDRKKPNKRS